MHKCVRCGEVYQDNDESILRGCVHCGSIFFLYLKTPEDSQQLEEIKKELEEKKTTLEEEIEKKIKEIKEERRVELEEKAVKKRRARVKFGIETVRIPKEGVYEINLDALMKKRPLIILEKGKVYFVHLPSVFERTKEL
ncbi:MAG: OapC/ArvC family zinc-ribbon domain-containing protein [Candidatus Aenigmatarchaeota archaeon]